MTPPAPASRAGWGWIDLRVLLACHIGLSASVSPAFLGVYGLFLKPMADDLGWARTDVAAGLAIVSTAAIGSVALAGLAVDRIGARAVTLVGAIGLPIALVLIALAPPSWLWFVCAALFMGLVGGGAASPCGYVSVLSRWFEHRLGLAIAIGVSGLGLGQALNAMVLSSVLDELSWRQAWFVLAAMVAVAGLAAHGLVPWHCISQRVPLARPRPEAGAATFDQRPCWQQPSFWMLALAFMLVLLVTIGVQVNIAATLADRQQAYLAATAVAVMGVASMIARFVGGVLLDHMPARTLGAIVFTMQSVGCVLLSVAATPSITLVGVFIISFAFGVEADILPFIVRRRYGIAQFGKAYGIMFGCVQLGAVVGPIAVAFTYDSLGNYDSAFRILALCSATAAAIVAVVLRSPAESADTPGRRKPFSLRG